MRQNQPNHPKSIHSGRRIALFAALLIIVSVIVAACVASYATPSKPQAAGSVLIDMTADAKTAAAVRATSQSTATPTNSPTASSTASPTVSATVSAMTTPTNTPTATAITASPLAAPLTAGESPADASPFIADQLTDLLAMTVTQSLTLSLGAPISSTFVNTTTDLSTEFVISATEPISVASTLTVTSLIETSLIETSPISVSVAEGETPTLIPTPTPSPVSAPLPDPTPDGIARTVQLPILMYHYVSIPPADADIYRQDLSIAPADFAAHLDRMLAEGYTAISLYDLIGHLTQGTPLPDKPVLLTFDDGYRDNYTNAFPALAERNMTATFFVVTDFIDGEQPAYFSWEMLREMSAAGMSIESHGRNHVTLQGQDADYLIWQALGSMETIEYELGVRPRFISYPAGDYDQATIDIFKSANYWAGLTTVQGATHDSDNLFELRRVRVRGTTTPDELIRLLALDW